jgi:propanol-preferring alcohol dehydrogenase
MKAHVLRAPAPVEHRPLSLEEHPMPTIADDELLVRVHACGVCRTDLHIVEGELPMRRKTVVPGHQIVGEIISCGAAVRDRAVGARVGIAWLQRTCGACRFCTSGRENLCDAAAFTGWTVDGGFAEYAAVPSRFAYELPESFDDVEAAPLLCAGIIGYRALRLTGLAERAAWSGARVGIYGFGAAGHVAIQLARSRGAEVYVATRDRARHQQLATELGAAWIGGARDRPPVALDAAIIFAPAGELVPIALEALDKGGVLVLGGIHMSRIPELEYRRIYDERVVRSVANNTRGDGEEFLAEAARIPVRTHTEIYPFDAVGEALVALRRDAIKGAAVIAMESRTPPT